MNTMGSNNNNRNNQSGANSQNKQQNAGKSAAGKPDLNNLNNQQKQQYGNVMNMAKQLEGKSQQELMQEAMKMASQGRQDGSLTDEKLTSFVKNISPSLNSAQKKKLEQLLKMMGQGR